MSILKTNPITVGLCVGILGVLLLNRPALPQVSADTATPESRTLHVTGDAQVNVPPDEVVMSIGIQSDDSLFDKAFHLNEAKQAAILALAQSFSIPKDQVQMDYMSVNPYYPYQQNNNFDVRKTIVITLKDMSKFQDFLAALVNLGDGNLQKIEFRTSDLRKYKDQARAMAITAAKQKADALAGELGEKVGRPETITEEQNSWYSYYDYWWGQGYNGNSQANAVQNIAQAPSNSSNSNVSDEPVAPGSIAVTARVSVIFDLAN